MYQVVQEHLRTFVAEARAQSQHGFGLPRFVAKEFERFLDCGILAAAGFARARCDDCGDDKLVAFACKMRGGVCPSCAARRMHETAAHLVDRVIPHIPMRQYVLTFPARLRPMLAYDARLLSLALTLFVRALFSHQRLQARRLGVTAAQAKPGSITFVQRFGSALQLTPHLHLLAPDGVFVVDPEQPEARPRFVRLAPPTREELDALLEKFATRLLERLVAQGRLPGPDGSACFETLDAQSDLLATLVADAAVPASEARPKRHRVSLGMQDAPYLSRMDGFSLHAGREIHENDRAGLERLCRYGLRPALASERLSRTEDGRLRYRLKRTFSDGTSEILLTPEALLRRLAALVPAPRTHQTRYHGCFAPNSRVRAAIIGKRGGKRGARSAKSTRGRAPRKRSTERAPEPRPRTPEGAHGGLEHSEDFRATLESPESQDLQVPEPPPDPNRRRYFSWAELLKRVHKIDVTTCARCQGRVRIIAFITEPTATAAILRHLGLPTTPPKIAPARAPPQAQFGCGDEFGDGAMPSDHEYYVDPPLAEDCFADPPWHAD